MNTMNYKITERGIKKKKMSLKCLFGHQWNGCKCSRCGKLRDEQHDWDLCEGRCKRCGTTRSEGHKWVLLEGKYTEKCTNCGKERGMTWNSSMNYDNDALYHFATEGATDFIRKNAAYQLLNLKDKRIFSHFWEICRALGIGKRGSLEISEYENKLIDLAVEIPCEESIAFLEERMVLFTGRNKDSYMAFIAQKRLRSIRDKVQGTPLAERIKRIKSLDINVSYSVY